GTPFIPRPSDDPTIAASPEVPGCSALPGAGLWREAAPRCAIVIGSVMDGRDVAQFGSALDWGSRGRRFKSGRPDPKTQGREVRGVQTGPSPDLREPLREPPALSRSRRLPEDLVHGRRALGQRRPDLVPVHRLGDVSRNMPDELADVLQWHVARAENRDE